MKKTNFDGRSEDGKDEWLTPPEIVSTLGPFDLDPCSPINPPWTTAKKHFTIEDNGLIQPWEGRVWLNPPYGAETPRWMRKMASHGNGIALIFARTETRTFFESVWGVATSILWIKGRLNFYHRDGTRGKYSGGAPSCLIAYGEKNAVELEMSLFLGMEGRITKA